jgi:hypothetical protein
MTRKKGIPELLFAALLLAGTFILTVVTNYCLLIAYQRHWPGTSRSDYLSFYGPFVAMFVPGLGYLFARKWITAVVLLVAGWLLAWGVIVIVFSVAWSPL